MRCVLIQQNTLIKTARKLFQKETRTFQSYARQYKWFRLVSFEQVLPMESSRKCST